MASKRDLKIEEASAWLRNSVERNPVLVLSVALGTGAVLGMNLGGNLQRGLTKALLQTGARVAIQNLL